MSYKLLYLEDCPFSIEAERLLKEHDKSYNKIVFTNNIDSEKAEKVQLDALPKNDYLKEGNKFEKKVFKDYFGESSTFPRIYLNEQLIGGCSDLEEHLKKSQSL